MWIVQCGANRFLLNWIEQIAEGLIYMKIRPSFHLKATVMEMSVALLGCDTTKSKSKQSTRVAKDLVLRASQVIPVYLRELDVEGDRCAVHEIGTLAKTTHLEIPN